MDFSGLTIGDVKAWATKILHDGLESVINAKSSYSLPYYILVIIKEGYTGAPAYGNSNELLHGEDTGLRPRHKDTKTVDMSGKRVVSHRFIILSQKPKIPLISSSLWYVNNKTGQVRCEYILPPDMPMIGGFDVQLESKTALMCGKNMPYIGEN